MIQRSRSFQARPALGRDVAEVGRVGGVADAEAERRNIAVLQQERPKASPDRPSLRWCGFRRPRSSGGRGSADIRCPAASRSNRRTAAGYDRAVDSVQIDRNAPALVHHDRAQIVDAVGLVGVLVGQEHGVEVIDIGVDQLLAQVGRGVDQDPGDRRVRRSARPAASSGGGGSSDCWDRRRPSRAPGAARRRRSRSRGSSASASCRRLSARGTLENRRKKFSVVWREISSSETPRVSASTLAISTT